MAGAASTCAARRVPALARGPGAISRDGVARARPRRASTSASVGRRDEREAQHAGAVVDADRLQRRAGAGGARRAGRAGRREHAARLERVQQRLGGQAGEGERGDVRRARRTRDRRAHARDDGGERGQRRLLEAIAQRRRPVPRRRPATAARASARGDAEADERRQVLGAAAQAALLPAADPERRERARPGAATARPRPAGRAACARRGRRCRRPARAAAGAARPNACTASTCRCGALRSPARPEQAGDLGDRLPRPELVVAPA